MFALIIFLLIGFTVSANNALDVRIAGGKIAYDGQFPYQVSIQQYKSHICSGCIINVRYILTTAACIYKQKEESFEVVAGTNNLSSRGDRYSVHKFIWNDSYNATKYVHDIGLIRVKKNIRFHEKVASIPLSFSAYIPVYEPATIAGWGSRTIFGKTSDELMELNTIVVPYATCLRGYVNMTRFQLCTYIDVGKGICNGDAGGPLIFNGAVVGIASLNRGCASGYPDIYTKVYPYHNWIHNITSHTYGHGARLSPNQWTLLLLFISTLLPCLSTFI